MSLYQEARAALRESSFKPRKRYGQNFLVSESIVEAIVRLSGLSPEDEIVEVGSGLGFLTRRLLQSARKVWAIELDPFLVEWLRKSAWGCHEALELIHGDVLEVDLGKLLPRHKVKLVANLPYSVSTPVLFRLFDHRDHFSILVLMVQREVAERMNASPGSKAYGTLSVWCQIHGRILKRVSVGPEAFYPRPKVRSTILKIALHAHPLIPEADLYWLRQLLRAAFGQRRKTLANSLSGAMARPRAEIEALLRGEGVDPRRRGETLSVGEFIRVARALSLSTN